MLEAFIYDAITVITVLFIFAGSFALAVATTIEVWHHSRGNLARNKVDEMYKASGNREPKNELNTWYAIRNKIQGDQSIDSKERHELMEAVQARITGCKVRNKAFATRDKLSGRIVIINNQN